MVNVTAAVMVLLMPGGKVPKDRSWKNAKVVMGAVDKFLDQLINYDKDHIPPECQKAVQPYLDNPEFEPEFIRNKSLAAAGLCSWVINIMRCALLNRNRTFYKSITLYYTQGTRTRTDDTHVLAGTTWCSARWSRSVWRWRRRRSS